MGRVEGEHVARPVPALVVVVVHEDARVTRVQRARGVELLQVAKVLDAVRDGRSVFELRDVANARVVCSLEEGGVGVKGVGAGGTLG